MLKILATFGTCPEPSKMALTVEALKKDSRFDGKVCLTGQHPEMLDHVPELFGIVPDFDPDLMRSSHGLTDITANLLHGRRGVLRQWQPTAFEGEAQATRLGSRNESSGSSSSELSPRPRLCSLVPAPGEKFFSLSSSLQVMAREIRGGISVHMPGNG